MFTLDYVSRKFQFDYPSFIYFGFRIFRAKPSLNIALKHKRTVNSGVINNLGIALRVLNNSWNCCQGMYYL